MLYCFALSLVLSWSALSTYWDEMFGYDNFYMHGFGIGMAMLPMMCIGIAWYLIIMRALLLGVLMGVWSNIIDTDWIEEMGRGFFIIITLPILII